MLTFSKLINHFFHTTCYGGLFGGIGYLAGRTIHHLNPSMSLVCGAIAGATTSLFLNKDAGIVRKTIGLAILIFAPQQICQLMSIPITFKACILVTGLMTALAIFLQIICQSNRQEVENIELEQEPEDIHQENDEIQKLEILAEYEQKVETILKNYKDSERKNAESTKNMPKEYQTIVDQLNTQLEQKLLEKLKAIADSEQDPSQAFQKWQEEIKKKAAQAKTEIDEMFYGLEIK